MLEGFPGEEPDGSRVIGETATDDINRTRTVLSVDLVGPTCENPPDNANVAFLWNGINVDGVIGGHRSGNAFLEDDDAR